MAIDKTELATELEKNPEIEKIAVDALAKKGFTVRDKASETSFLDNYKKDVIEKEFPAKFSELNNKYDADIESITGLKKESSEKTHDYLKRATQSKLTEMDGKIKGYEKTIAEKGDPTGIWQKKIEDAQEQARKAIAEKDTTIKDLSAKTEFAARKSMVDAAYADLSKTFRKDLPPLFDRSARLVLEDVMKQTILEDGVLYISDGNGLKKKDANFNPIKVDDVLKSEFKEVISKTPNGNGGGSGKGDGKGDNPDPLKINKDNFILPADAKTQMDVMGAMIKSGIKRGSETWNEVYNKYALGYETITVNGKKERKTLSSPLPLGN